jgi:lipopolysaccharide/colanic/teichoic acid biosynthesis glycosyltransferase
MVHNCERATGPQWAVPGDPRVTWLGALLRRTHLDELPQLWNVLRGEMSLVGPRPERPGFVRQLEQALPHYPERMAVLPGITGLAQVQHPADEDLAGVRRKLDYDLCYLERIGLWLDVRIVAATALKVLGVPFEITGRLLALPQPDAPGDSPLPVLSTADWSGTRS